jgi:hypothetical protein
MTGFPPADASSESFLKIDTPSESFLAILECPLKFDGCGGRDRRIGRTVAIPARIVTRRLSAVIWAICFVVEDRVRIEVRDDFLSKRIRPESTSDTRIESQ